MTQTKTPQDHKKPQAELDAEKQARFSETPGHELLRPFSKVKGSDQLRLLARLTGLGLIGDDDDDEDAGPKLDDLDFDLVADLIDYVSAHFANDPDEFDKWTMGNGGFERAMNLAVAYAGELGNADD